MQQKKILIVDDDPDLVAAVEAVFKSKTYHVVTAFDGVAGLQKVLDERPDLIVLDVIMPKKHGFEVCKELKTDPRYHSVSKIPVLLLTVYPHDREKLNLPMLEGMLMEAEDYIQKPFDPSELLERAEKLLETVERRKSA